VKQSFPSSFFPRFLSIIVACDVVDDVTAQMVPGVSISAVSSVVVEPQGSSLTAFFSALRRLQLVLQLLVSASTSLSWKRRDDVTEDDVGREAVGRASSPVDLNNFDDASLFSDTVESATFG